MKTLEEIGAELDVLYTKLDNGEVELKKASEMANVAGKRLKAHQLVQSRQVIAANIEKLKQRTEC